MQLGYVIAYVENVTATLDFYEQAFGLERKLLTPEGDYGEMATGTTTLAFAARRMIAEMGKAPGKANANAPVFEMAFTVDDVGGAFAHALENGAVSVQEPKQMPWGQTICYVSDPDGFLVEICTPIAG